MIGEALSFFRIYKNIDSVILGFIFPSNRQNLLNNLFIFCSCTGFSFKLSKKKTNFSFSNLCYIQGQELL